MDSTIRKKVKVGTVFFCVIAGILFAIGTFYDLEIDKALLNFSNPFAEFMERFGMLPQYSVKLFAFSVLVAGFGEFDRIVEFLSVPFPVIKIISASTAGAKFLKIVYYLLYILFIYEAFEGSNDFLNFILRNALDGKNIQDLLTDSGAGSFVAIAVWSLARIAPIVITVSLARRLDAETLHALEFMAIAGIFVYISSDIINLLKAHFCRVRFREMIAYSNGLIDKNGMSHIGGHDIPREWIDKTDFSAFDRWYRIGDNRGIYSEPTSFPSGHTSAASFSMLMIPLFARVKKLNKYLPFSMIIGFGYVAVMGYTRLLRGAHYLTDVTGAALIMTAISVFFVTMLDLALNTLKLKKSE